jgi:hypothetical protein
MADFETEMSAVLAAITWTACTSQPQTNYGTVNADAYNPLLYLRVRNDEDSTVEGGTFTGTVIYEDQKGTIEG